MDIQRSSSGKSEDLTTHSGQRRMIATPSTNEACMQVIKQHNEVLGADSVCKI